MARLAILLTLALLGLVAAAPASQAVVLHAVCDGPDSPCDVQACDGRAVQAACKSGDYTCDVAFNVGVLVGCI